MLASRAAEYHVPITLRPNCNVTHLECEGSRISKVHYRDPSGRQQTVSGKVVVVACSAIESIRLLKLSALQSSEFDKRGMEWKEVGEPRHPRV